jgi:signal transduction histidine kinase
MASATDGRSFMDKWILSISVLCFLTAVFLAVWSTWRTKRTLERIEKMLDTAMDGKFTEEVFDESRLSALETKFAHYLSSSVVSAKAVSEEKDKIKTLIADISHQTKTPIANLLLYSELLEEEALWDSARCNVEAIHNQTEKLHFLIDSLVKLSRLENGILTLSPRQERLLPTLQKVYQEFLSKAEAKGLQLILRETEEMAVFDPKWTAEALGNLVDNAIKYTGQGSIVISATAYELFVKIDVRDTGNGIPEEEQAKIFSRFYRSENARDTEGVGIGLYLAREIVSGEGGYIKVTSVPSEGSTFSVLLPR